MIPTVGFNMRKVSKGGVTIKLWDLGGQVRCVVLFGSFCSGFGRFARFQVCSVATKAVGPGQSGQVQVGLKSFPPNCVLQRAAAIAQGHLALRFYVGAPPPALLQPALLRIPLSLPFPSPHRRASAPCGSATAAACRPLCLWWIALTWTAW